MENRLTVNKRLISVMFIFIIFIYLQLRIFDPLDGMKETLSADELEYLDELKDDTLNIYYTESFLINSLLLDKIQEYVSIDLGLNILFKPISDVEKEKIEVFRYSSVLYGMNTDYIYDINDIKKSIVGITNTEIQNQINEYYPNVDIAFIKYNSIDELNAAINEGDIDYYIYEYMGDFIDNTTSDSDIFLILELEEIKIPVYMYIDDLNEIEVALINKIFAYFIEDNTMAHSLAEANLSKKKSNIKNIFTEDELLWLSGREKLKFGIEEYPPISYFKDSNIYGFAISYANQLGRISEKKIEFTIGEQSKLEEFLIAEKLDYIITINSSIIDYHSNPFNRDELLVTSNIDYSIIDDLTSLQDESIYFFGPEIELTDFSKTVPYLDIEVLSSFDKLIELIEIDELNYFLMSKSTYLFLNTVKDVNALNINYVTGEFIESKFVSNDDLSNRIINKIILLSKSDYFNETALKSIPTEKSQKRTRYIILITTLVLVLVISIYLIIRLTININEKHRLNYLFKHDQLTYLPNNYGIRKIYESTNSKKDQTGTLFLLDLDKFKLLNDKYGGDVGDQILIELANVFNNMNEDIIVGRTGGDEFSFLVFNIDEPLTVVDEITEAFENFTINESRAKYLSFTISYVEFPKFTADYDTLIQYVESAMYFAKAKKENNNWVAFTEDIYNSYLKEQEMSQDISNALVNNEFLLYYQPQVELNDESIMGAEVLVRWYHPEKGFIYPDQFLPVAERNGLMRHLDMYMITHACRQIKLWQDTGEEKMKISVNMSTATFESQDMISDLFKIVKSSDIDISWFALEITEESGLGNLDKAKEMMDEIKSIGIRFSLDDFGKGYSSLSYLERLPFDYLKIDKAFIDNIHTNEKSKQLYLIITKLAKLFDMVIVSEGVEYIEQIEVIKSISDTIVQGYYYSKPLTLKDFNDMINRKEAF